MNKQNNFCIFVYFFIISLGLILKSVSDISARIGLAPDKIILFMVDAKVIGVVITSSVFFLNLMTIKINGVLPYMN